MLFCLVPSPEFSQTPWYSLPDHLCRFGVRSLNAWSLEVFLGSVASTASRSYKTGSSSHLDLEIPDLPETSVYLLEPGQPSPGPSSLLRHHIAAKSGAGILTSFPSTTPFGLALGADSPCADERCAGTLGLPARRIFTSFIVTHVSIRTSDTSSGPLGPPSQAYRTLLYRARPSGRAPAASVHGLSPVKSSAQADSTSELLRFL